MRTSAGSRLRIGCSLRCSPPPRGRDPCQTLSPCPPPGPKSACPQNPLYHTLRPHYPPSPTNSGHLAGAKTTLVTTLMFTRLMFARVSG
eukprot:429175-Pyramimonas_sp.AAC.1